MWIRTPRLSILDVVISVVLLRYSKSLLRPRSVPSLPLSVLYGRGSILREVCVVSAEF